MLRIAICDDDKALCADLEKKLEEYRGVFHLDMEVEVFYRAETLVTYLEQGNSFDIILLDIELETMTGVGAARKIRREMDDYITKIVFISSKEGYEQELFDVQPLNFLRKPIDSRKLFKCIELAAKLLEKGNEVFEYRVSRETRRVPVKKILYFENNLKRMKIVTTTGEEYFYAGLKSVLEQLPASFVSTHVSYIVNYDYIERIDSKEVTMTSGKVIPVSKGRLKDLYEMQAIRGKEVRDVNL